MIRKISHWHAGIVVLLANSALLFGCAERATEVSFATDVKPIIDAQCGDCHRPGAGGYEQSGLSLVSHEDLMRGTQFGRIVIPGDSLTSILVMLVEGRADPSITMPHGRSPLSAEEIALIKTWVEQGARNN